MLSTSMRLLDKTDAMRKQRRRKLRRLGYVAGAVCLSIAHGGAYAQTDVSKPKSEEGGAVSTQAPAQPAPAMQPNWAVNCATVETELNCVASQAFFVKETAQRLMTVSVNPPRGSKKTTLVLLLPLGIYLPAGVSMQFGNAAAKTIPIISCDQNGCMAEYTATDAELKLMLGGEPLLITVRARDQKPITVNVPFAGFDKAYSKLS